MAEAKKNKEIIPSEVPELNIEEIRKRWEHALRGVLEKTVKTLEQKMPEQIRQEDAPQLLEKITSERIKVKKSEASFVVISASASVGKSTVGKIIEGLGLKRLPRVTSREKRSSETNGHDYFFLSPEEFDRQRQSGEFLFSKETYGKGRAISKKLFDQALASDKKFYAEGDALAYHEIIKNYPEYKNVRYQSIFLLPPSFTELLRRLEELKDREEEKISTDEIKKRLEQAIFYLEESGNHIVNNIYDGFLVNDELSRVEQKIKEYLL